jgi:uncharacterized protein (TIGR03083 family)
MDTPGYLQSIERDCAVILAAGTSLPLDTGVPSCPGWTVRDLIVHTGQVHRNKTETVRDGWVHEGPPRPPGPEGDPVEWFAEGATEMLGVLRSADLSQPTWTWCAHDHTAAWWVRRMAHETAIHGADAVLASGGVPVLDPDLAIDGVDEILDEMMVGGPEWGTVTPTDRVIALECGDRRWLLRSATFVGTSPRTGTHYDMPALVHEREAEPDATVRTDPSTLDLWLWGRAPLPEGSVSGDRSLVDELRTLAAEATT